MDKKTGIGLIRREQPSRMIHFLGDSSGFADPLSFQGVYQMACREQASLRDSIYPEFVKLRKDFPGFKSAKLEIGSYSPGVGEGWNYLGFDWLLRSQPAEQARLAIPTAEDSEPYIQWLKIAEKASGFIGEWSEAHGVKSRSFRPRTAATFILAFVDIKEHLGLSASTVIPGSYEIEYGRCDWHLIPFSENSIVPQTQVPGQRELAFASCMHVRIDDLVGDTIAMLLWLLEDLPIKLNSNVAPSMSNESPWESRLIPLAKIPLKFRSNRLSLTEAARRVFQDFKLKDPKQLLGLIQDSILKGQIKAARITPKKYVFDTSDMKNVLDKPSESKR